MRATTQIAVRLKKLLASGLISKTVVLQDARRFDYALTKKGNDLFPLLMTLLAWGDKWSPGDKGPLVKLRHAGCGKLTRAGLVCTQCGEALHPDNLRTSFAPAYKEFTHAH